MLKKFAALLVASAFIAGPAFAAQSTATSGGAPAAQTANAASATTQVKPVVKPAKIAKHTVKHARVATKTRVAHAKTGKIHLNTHLARHMKPARTHQAAAVKATQRS